MLSPLRSPQFNMISVEQCRIQNLIKHPTCSTLNLFIFLGLLLFIAAAAATIAYSYRRYYQTTRLILALEEHLRGRLIDENDSLLINGPPTRDRPQSEIDDETSPSPNPTSVRYRWQHFLRVTGIRSISPPPAPSAVFDDTTSSASIGSDGMYMAGDGVQRPRLGVRRLPHAHAQPVQPVIHGTQESIQTTVWDRTSTRDHLLVIIGPVTRGTIARRRRSSASSEQVFAIDIDV